MSWRETKRWGAAGLAVCLLAGCAGPGGRRPAPSKLELSADLRHEVYEFLLRQNDRVRSLRGRAGVRIGANLLRRAHGDTAIALSKPFSLRVDALSDFGIAPFQIAVHKGQLDIYWPGENYYFRGLASPSNLARYLGISLDPETVIRFLSGGIPVEEEYRYRLLEGRRAGEVVLRSRAQEIVLKQEGRRFLPVHMTIFGLEGRKVYRVSFEGYGFDGNGDMPERLSFHFQEPKVQLSIRYRDLEINPAVPKDLFRLNVPVGAKRVHE